VTDVKLALTRSFLAGDVPRVNPPGLLTPNTQTLSVKVAVVGGGALTEGVAFEGLNQPGPASTRSMESRELP
jgi:hypothetical protein